MPWSRRKQSSCYRSSAQQQRRTNTSHWDRIYHIGAHTKLATMPRAKKEQHEHFNLLLTPAQSHNSLPMVSAKLVVLLSVAAPCQGFVAPLASLSASSRVVARCNAKSSRVHQVACRTTQSVCRMTADTEYSAVATPQGNSNVRISVMVPGVSTQVLFTQTHALITYSSLLSIKARAQVLNSSCCTALCRKHTQMRSETSARSSRSQASAQATRKCLTLLSSTTTVRRSSKGTL
jgi:hypothetical protein